MSTEHDIHELLETLSEHFARVEHEMADMRERIEQMDEAVAEPSASELVVSPAIAPAEAQQAQAVAEPVPEVAPTRSEAPVLAPTCSSCGSLLESGSRFCVSCGAPVTAQSAAEPATRPAIVEPERAVVAALAVAPRPEAPRGPGLIERLRGDLSWWEFFGRRVLVWVAGVVIVFGLVLLYIRAVEAGWVGPVGRVALGTALSLGMLGGAFLLRNRYDSDDGGLVAAGVALAGLYASAFAAVRMYDLLPSWAGMLCAFAIAALAVWVALRWSSQPLAMLGLAGASLAPPLISQTVTPVSMGFVAIVAAAGGVLWLRRDWLWLVGMTTAISLPQAIAMVGLTADKPTTFGWNRVWQSALVAAGYWAVYEALVVARRRALARDRLDQLCGWASLGAAAFALYAAAVLFDGDGRGYAMLGVGAIYLGLATLLWWIEPGQRDLMTITWATAVTAITIGLMLLVGGATLVVALALQGALHMVVSRRIDEPRLQLSAAVQLVLAAGFALALAPPAVLTSYPPDALMRGGALAGDLVRQSAVSVVAVAAGIWTFAALRRPVYVWQTRGWQVATFWTAVVAVLYAVSTVIVDMFLWQDTSARSFENGHTLVSVTWALIALALVYVGFRQHMTDVRIGGLILFVAALAKLFFYDLRQLESMARAVSFITVGLILLAGGVVYRQLALREAEESARPGKGEPPRVGQPTHPAG